MANDILIIEDDEFLREMLVKKISSEGFGVSQAVNGQDGIDKIKSEMPRLVLLDLLLPDLSGFDVLLRAKADSSTASIPIVILSNLGQKEDIDKGLNLGATDFLIKSQFTTEEIVEKIKNIFKTK